MIRGILGGVLWGGLFAALALAVVSQTAAPPTGRPLIPAAADKPVAVAVAELEAAAPVVDAPAAPGAAAQGNAAPGTQPASNDVPAAGSEEVVMQPVETGPNTPASENHGSGADAEKASAAMPVTAPDPQIAEAKLPDAEVDLSQPDGQRPTDDAVAPKPVPPAAAGAPAAPVAASDPASANPAPLNLAAPNLATSEPARLTPAPLPETVSGQPEVPATRTEQALARTPETASALGTRPSAPDAPPAGGTAPVVDRPLPGVETVPPQVVTEAPAPPVGPADPIGRAPTRVAELDPPQRAPAPARLQAALADPAPGLAAAVPAPSLAEALPAPVVPPVAQTSTPDSPAEAPVPDPVAVPPAPEVAVADAAPPAVDQPEPAPDAVDSAEAAVVTRPSRLVPDAGLGSGTGTPRATGLPRIIGPAAEATPEVAATDPVLVEAEAGLADDRPAIERFARDFENPAGKPVFAIVLIDEGDPALDRRTLAAMPFPVTFLLDPAQPESAMAASIYREGGQEVAMLATDLPKGATASDLEVTFAAYGDVLPEAVAIVDPEDDGFQGDRALATMVAPIAAGQGRGLLSWDRGLNAAEQVARREGLRSGVIYRRLDGEGEEAGTMRRYLDRAAFKAAQDGRVIVAGGTGSETIAALLEWAVEGRATTVALAPLSAALRAD